MKKKYIFLIIILFLLVLSFTRSLWMDYFSNVSDIEIENGSLHLEDWQAQDDEILLLDGDWEFYPSQLIYSDGESSNVNKLERQFIYVPDGWREALEEGEKSPYGYGSYRLKLYVNPDEDKNYSLFVPSVRSASEVYINGRSVAHSGEVGTSRETHHAKNLPYTTTFTADENGEIEIVVQASNFQDTRRSGIIRSLKFGSEAALAKERNIAVAIQAITAALLLMHALYAITLYFLGRRDTKLLFFALFLISVTVLSLLSSDEKAFHLLFNISYEWDFRLVNLTGPIIGYSLFRCIDRDRIPYWHIVHPVYFLINLLFVVMLLFASPELITSLILVNALIALFAIVLMLITIVRRLYLDVTENLLLLLSFIALMHSIVWTMFWRETGSSIIHYPFDYLIAIGLFTSVWFKNYFTVHAQTRKLAQELQTINEQKDQFLANTSHEFRNPLHGIINMSQSVLFREKDKLTENSSYELKSVVTIGKRMSLLLNDLLDEEQIKKGRPVLRKSNFKLQRIVRGVIDMLEFTVDLSSVQIINEVPDDFPMVYADENRSTQIIYNLLHNAIKFTDDGDVFIRTSVKNGRAFIKIEDTGKGIDEEFLKRLFLPYEQAKRDGMIHSGLGLGLSISKQLVEQHGGELEVTSKQAEGSTFTFSFELASEVADEQIDENEKQKLMIPLLNEVDVEKKLAAISRFTTEGNRPSILVVDDDPMNIQVLESILSVEHFEVKTALSGKEALRKLNDRDWSLIIADVMMSGISGYELTETIRERYSVTELPILLLTARSSPSDIQTGLLLGANDYVTKPVDRMELLARVHALTTLKSAVRDQLHLEAIWLQAQIQPHFLFNTLNSLAALSEIDVKRMSELLIDFSDFLKSKFQFQHVDGLIPIEEELLMVESYVNIELVRFSDRLEVEWNIDTNEGIDVPFLSIQSLVENAINHGVMKLLEGGKVTISTNNTEDGVLVSVADNGVGIEEDKLANLRAQKIDDRSSIGLININKRLQKHYGTGLDIQSKVGKGTVVSFLIPT